MPNSRYKFNPESLSFDRIRLGIGEILLRGLAYLVGSLLIAVIYYVIFAVFFDSPKEKALLREIDQLTLQYDLIHREMNNIEKVIDQLQATDDNLYRTIFETTGTGTVIIEDDKTLSLINTEFEKVTEMSEIMKWPILSTPGLVVNGKVVSSGRIPSEAEIAGWLKSA